MSTDDYDSLRNQQGREATFCAKQGHLIETMFLKTGAGRDVYCKACGVRVSLRIVNLFREAVAPMTGLRLVGLPDLGVQGRVNEETSHE